MAASSCFAWRKKDRSSATLFQDLHSILCKSSLFCYDFFVFFQHLCRSTPFLHEHQLLLLLSPFQLVFSSSSSSCFHFSVFSVLFWFRLTTRESTLVHIHARGHGCLHACSLSLPFKSLAKAFPLLLFFLFWAVESKILKVLVCASPSLPMDSAMDDIEGSAQHRADGEPAHFRVCSGSFIDGLQLKKGNIWSCSELYTFLEDNVSWQIQDCRYR